MTGLLLPASFIAAFLAGLVALFAPCCITFLLPSYLGSVFKTRSRILFMTFVFGLGIFVILLPAVLGISLVSRFLFRYHDLAYYTGGVAMVIAGLLALWGVKFALPRLPRPTAPQGQPDIFSVFVLGLISGLASACCAPVLIGILSLSFLSGSFWGALALGATYVLGMVAPLFIAGFFIDKRQLLNRNFFNQNIGSFKLGNIISAAVFIPMGLFIIYLTFAGRLNMDISRHYAGYLQNTAATVEQKFNSWLSPASADQPPATRTAQSGDVAVTVTFESGKFNVALDTHSVDLSAFDFSASVKLKTAGSELSTASVTPVSDAAHHRSAILTFPSVAGPFTIIISDLVDTSPVSLFFERR